MNKIKILVVVAGLASLVSAQDLWNFSNLTNNDPYNGQVKTPGAIYCWANAPEPSASNDWGSDCYDGSGGWWFGYGDEGGKTYDAVSNADLTLDRAVLITEYIQGEGQTIVTGKGMGNGSKGLDVKFVTTAGTATTPSVAGMGFNWRADPLQDNDYQSKKTEDLNSKTGLCIVYEADQAGVDVELGWNEAQYGYDTWIVTLPAGNCTVNMPWSDFLVSYESADDEQPLSIALDYAESLKIALKNKDAAPKTINFTLKGLGWNGSCGSATSSCVTNSLSSGKIVSMQSFNLNGRLLSIANATKSTSVQVINMHGVVVAQKTLAPNENLSLANMPVGVYVVRSTELGILQRIMIK